MVKMIINKRFPSNTLTSLTNNIYNEGDKKTSITKYVQFESVW